tara:strand:+ start:316 stop:489 length:174 start_codon:yes stop_codon:yes gene_type:complete
MIVKDKYGLSYNIKDKDIDDIYNEVIQDYDYLQDEYEGDELQDKIMEIVNSIMNNTN